VGRRQGDRPGVAGTGASEPRAITAPLDVARSTVEWHLSNLTECNVVTRRPDAEGNGVVVEVNDPSTVYRLLREVEPRFSDRPVDRFSRFADELLLE